MWSRALVAFVILYIIFLSRGPTIVSVISWSVPSYNIAFASLVPWVAGMSWEDPIGVIYFVLRKTYLTPDAYLAALVPPALLVAGLVLFWRPQTTGEKKFRLFCLWFYALVTAALILL